MATDRRSFLKTVSAVGGAAGLGVFPGLAHAAPPGADAAWSPKPVTRAPVSLNMLILGGTGFTGPEQVEYAIARGHRVTLFNRNRTRPGMFRGRVAEELVGDLNNDTSALEGKQFDVVLDNPTTFPAWVRNAGKYLAGNVKHYVFISTTSVYSDQSIIGIDESSPVQQLPADVDPYTLDPQHSSQYYGHLKVRAEEEVRRTYPDMWTVIRPCLIVGPLDRTDRFTWWPARIDQGGEVLAPDKPDDPCQFIDARDLAEWMVRVAENRVLGLYNAVGPAHPMTIAEMLYGVKAVTTAGAQFTWVPWEFLQQQEVRPWRHMTVWQPPYGRTAGYQRRKAEKAIAAGLTFRPMAVTAKDTLDWHKTRPAEEQQRTLNGEVNGIGMRREAEVLAAWRASQRSL
ncbi:MAG TPA: NAD-dependent epimerase/dehydratase family protein [Longimicrobiales bacterium]|nr:NAD-dependent epimerase/dehydratase family protein [Longimicrobiales bacterium]